MLPCKSTPRPKYLVPVLMRMRGRLSWNSALIQFLVSLPSGDGQMDAVILLCSFFLCTFEVKLTSYSDISLVLVPVSGNSYFYFLFCSFDHWYRRT